MIRKMAIEDLAAIDIKEKDSMSLEVWDALTNDKWLKFSLIKDGSVKFISALLNYKKRKWCIFTVPAVEFKATYCRELRNFYAELEKEHRPKLLWTMTADEPAKNKFHQFIGLTRKKKISFRGNEYNIWARTWA
jgi:protease II